MVSLLTLADRVLPEDLDGRDRVRAQLGVVLSGIVGILLVAFSPLFHWLLGLPTIALACVLVGLAFGALTMAWGRLTHLLALQVLLFNCYVLETIAVLQTGGPSSPFIPLVLFPVLYAALLGSTRTAILWTLIAGAYPFLLALLPPGDFGVPPDPVTFWQVVVPPMVGIGASLVVITIRLQEDARERAADAQTRAVEARREEAEARHAAAQAGRVKNDFLAVASHELRTPLTQILGAADLLAKSPSPSEVERWSGVIGASGRRLSTLLEELLAFKQIEQGSLELEPTAVHLPALLEQVVADLGAGTRLQLVLLPDLVSEVQVDGPKLSQILLNLVGNALKFTEQEVVLRASGSAVFEVIDRGPGIRRERFELLLKPFVRAQTGPDRSQTGAGLGLTLSQRLTLAMGGRLELLDSPSGAHFRVEIPLEASAAEAATPACRRVLDVLVVDDDAVTRLIAARMVNFTGHQAREADGGEQALEICRDDRPDVVLLDWHMPGLDGFSTAEALTERHPDLPVFGFTASTAPAEHRRARAAGMRAVLAKPIEIEILRDLLAEAASTL